MNDATINPPTKKTTAYTVMVRNIGTPALLSDNAHFSQKNVAISNVLVFTCLFINFLFVFPMQTKAKSEIIPHRTPKVDWTKLLAP